MNTFCALIPTAHHLESVPSKMSLIDHSPPPLPAAPIEHSYLFICNRVVTHVQKEKKRGQSYISNATPIQLFKDNRLLFCKGARKINFVYFARLKKKMLN